MKKLLIFRKQFLGGLTPCMRMLLQTYQMKVTV